MKGRRFQEIWNIFRSSAAVWPKGTNETSSSNEEEEGDATSWLDAEEDEEEVKEDEEDEDASVMALLEDTLLVVEPDLPFEDDVGDKGVDDVGDDKEDDEEEEVRDDEDDDVVNAGKGDRGDDVAFSCNEASAAFWVVAIVF